MNVGIILAGGKGNRIGSKVPKQYLEVLGKTILEYSVNAFENCAVIDEIAIVVNEKYISLVQNIIDKNSWKKVKKVLNGGAERYDSSLSAIKAYKDCDCNLIFHDSVRPLVSERIITETANALKKYNAVAVAVPATDTIIETNNGDFIDKILVRNKLRCQQTPQAFRIDTIMHAYEIALDDSEFTSTDDCGVVAKYLPEEKIFIVDGDDANIKITYPKDLAILECLLKKD